MDYMTTKQVAEYFRLSEKATELLGAAMEEIKRRFPEFHERAMALVDQWKSERKTA